MYTEVKKGDSSAFVHQVLFYFAPMNLIKDNNSSFNHVCPWLIIVNNLTIKLYLANTL